MKFSEGLWLILSGEKNIMHVTCPLLGVKGIPFSFKWHFLYHLSQIWRHSQLYAHKPKPLREK